MMRRLLSGLAALMLLATVALPVAMATETQDATEETQEETTQETTPEYSTATSGTCGKDISWSLNGHTLTLTGSGKMDDGCPWIFYKDTITTLKLVGEITHIGAESFSTCNNLRYIDFGQSLKEIGYRAFYSCNAIQALRMPASFRKFEQECFLDCDGLQVIYCDGPMPSFRGSCLYTNHTVQVLYSAETPWPYEEVERLMTNFGSRVHVDVGSPEALEEYWEDAPAETEPTVPETTVPETTVPETTVPETTVPETAVPETTVPVTENVTEPVQIHSEPAETQEVFVLESEPLFVTEDWEETREEAEEEPQDDADTEGLSMGTWVVIAAAGVTGLLILLLVIRMVIHSGIWYRD